MFISTFPSTAYQLINIVEETYHQALVEMISGWDGEHWVDEDDCCFNTAETILKFRSLFPVVIKFESFVYVILISGYYLSDWELDRIAKAIRDTNYDCREFDIQAQVRKLVFKLERPSTPEITLSSDPT